MDVSDVKVTDDDGFSVLQHDDQSKEHHHEGTNLDQSCRSARSCFQYLHQEPGHVARCSRLRDVVGTFFVSFN